MQRVLGGADALACLAQRLPGRLEPAGRLRHLLPDRLNRIARRLDRFVDDEQAFVLLVFFGRQFAQRRFDLRLTVTEAVERL